MTIPTQTPVVPHFVHAETTKENRMLNVILFAMP
jgi:hypothetical protein